MIKFGPSGNSDIFFEQGYSTTLQALEWVKKLGLDLYEYSFGHGYTMSSQTAQKIGELSKNIDLDITVHAPYYINLCSADEITGSKSIDYVLKGVEYSKLLTSSKLVVHTGTQMKLERNNALKYAQNRFDQILQTLYKNNNANDIFICPETMGKYSQIGNYKEIIELCKLDKILVPTLDFGHINCLEQGNIKTKDDYKFILDYLIDKLGDYKANNFHIHFSKIQFSPKGEIKHLTFDDNEYGPPYQPLLEVLKEMNLSPTIICESKSTMAENALEMKKYFKNIGGK